MTVKCLDVNSRIQLSVDVSPLLSIAADCLRFVTEFFEVIRQSGPHIYHSALLLAPESSVVRKLYSQKIYSPVSKVINGIPASWDSCTATAGVTGGVHHAVWSPCGQFIAATLEDAIQVQDSSTLERVSILEPSRINQQHRGVLAFSPNGHLLACVYRTNYLLVVFPASMFVLTPIVRNYKPVERVFVWDVRTGVVVTKFDSWGSSEHMFTGNCGTVILLGESGTLEMYNGLDGTCIWNGVLGSSSHLLLGTHWGHEESVRFSTCSGNGRDYVVNIQELQPTSATPLPLIKSFPVDAYPGKMSFSPVSSHISFVTKEMVVVLDVRNPGTPLIWKPAGSLYTPPGCFSPDGKFFACGTEEHGIHIWENKLTSYVPQNTLWPRFPFDGFSFSPITSSILTWGQKGIQLLVFGRHPTILSPGKPKTHEPDINHIVAYSADGTHIATAQKMGSFVTVLNCLSSATLYHFGTGMEILDIKIADDTIFVADGHMLVGWHLKTREVVHSSETTAIIASIPHPYLTLSNNCSQIAFTSGETLFSDSKKGVFLYDVQAHGILCNYPTQYLVEDIRFSPDGCQLWFIVPPDDIPDENSLNMEDDLLDDESITFDYNPLHLVKLEWGESGTFTNATSEHLSGEYDAKQPWVDCFSSHGWRVGGKSEWVTDSMDNRILWLPLSWRVKQSQDVRWDGSFLAFVGGDHPAPIIIKFQP